MAMVVEVVHRLGVPRRDFPPLVPEGESLFSKEARLVETTTIRIWEIP